MTKSRRHPTSPYLLRRLRSYEEVRAERQSVSEDGTGEGRLEQQSHDGEFDRKSE